MATISFDELIARKEQREADKLRIGALKIPDSDRTLEAKMPAPSIVMSIYGAMCAAESAEQMVVVARKALYSVAPQLQDSKLHEALGCTDEPIRVIDQMFTVAEIDIIGGQALQFMGLLSDGKSTAQDTGLETVKN